ncbi:hypothetical protein DSAG12_00123 [Promethearchaeum syntrophicum]|uniref:Uncharacterized protein n=1 Tax=Promethearchaeum syntrophicum TaxID=2594042 RepID=A0A5B9D5U1_9ARCH|nr:hypothetical protein [Candidatus Prometheoarchaeum syntrophicum]QEE14311.1 hypothetical protein DSAG12_00123 [Candidatus Prometheoarchaeum syntrophicum]
MSEMLTDLLQNIYNRISTLGKSINSLQMSIDNLNKTFGEKVGNLVGSMNSMMDNVEKEGETQKLLLEQIGDEAIREVLKLQDKIGLKDLEELSVKLSKIVETSEEALKPEVVDLLLKEVLEGVKSLKESPIKEESKVNDEELLKKVSSSIPKPTPKKGKNLKNLGPPPGN